MKTKEIREYIQSMGFERGVIHVLEALSEENKGLRKDLNEAGQHLLLMAQNQQQFVDFAGVIKEHVQKLERHTEEDDDDLGPSTHSIGRDDN